MIKDGFFESDVEEAALEWFDELGYEIALGPDLIEVSKERASYEEVLLTVRLKDTLQRLNPEASLDVIDQAYREIAIPKHVSLIDNNQAFHNLLVNGIDVGYHDTNGQMIYQKIRVFDFANPENNSFLAVNQYTVIENNINKRPDVVILINGIPVVVFELKTLSDDKVSIDSAYNQIKNYQSSITSLFVYNDFNVLSDGIHAQVGTLTSQRDRYTAWRTIDGEKIAPLNEPQLETLIKGMFEKQRLLDIIKQFVLFQNNDKEVIKIIAGYHQYHAVNTALSRTYQATSEKGDRRIGVIWHTQGSGKSLSMVFFAGKMVISESLNNPTILVITDRNDLDDQLYQTFAKSENLLRSIPQQASSRNHLKELLNGRESGGIIFTTIQKFSPEENQDHQPLTTRMNVIVMADEAHRSQYGFSAKVVQTDDEAYERYGFAKYMRESLPNASYIGFTGTPIEHTDKNTRAVFGEYIDIYDMTRAVEDNTTVKVFYESRIAKLTIQVPEEELNANFENITEGQEKDSSNEMMRKWSRLEKIVGSPTRIKMVANDIVDHFEKRQNAMETPVGKAMIVAMSRRIAVDLYNEIIKLRPDWHSDDLYKGKIKVVMTGSSSDPEEWQVHVGNKQKREILAKRMKDNQDELEIAIVRDMWLTGFDVPSLHTMYIDKPMRGHGLMQTIARVNRVFGKKQGGLVVDYIGIAANLRDALSNYTDQDKNAAGVDTDAAVNVLLEKIGIVRDTLHQQDYSKYFSDSKGEKLKAIVQTANFVLGLEEETRKTLYDNVDDISKAFGLCATTDKALVVNEEVGFYKAVKAASIKFVEPGATPPQKNGHLEIDQLIAEAFKGEGVVDVMEELGLANPELSILSDKFVNQIKKSENKNIAIELLKRLIKGGIKRHSRRTVVQSKQFSEVLSNLIEKYNGRLLTSVEIIDELIKLAKDIMQAEQKGKESGLSVEEYAFYEALSSNTSAMEVMGTDVLRDIAKELTKTIQENASVDWSLRKTIQAKMRFEIKLLLRKYKYPPDDPSDPNNYDRAIKIIMEQTELLAEESSSNI